MIKSKINEIILYNDKLILLIPIQDYLSEELYHFFCIEFIIHDGCLFNNKNFEIIFNQTIDIIIEFKKCVVYSNLYYTMFNL